MGPQDGDGFPDDPGDFEVPNVDAREGLPTIEKFETIRILGEGGMGRVVLARDTTLDRLVAIKLISDDRFADGRARDRFLREAKAMATVEHPHVVRVYEFGEKDGRDFIVMEYVEGESLADRIRREGALPVAESLGIVLQAIEALDAAWRKGVVHRDVKPSNILLDEAGSVRVADFGIAGHSASCTATTLTSSGAVLGTPQYIAPEQALGKVGVDFRADIYSLGIVLYQLLTGGHPFPSETPVEVVDHHLHTPLPSPRDRKPEIPESVEQLLFWMTKKERSERPESYGALAAEIRSILAGDGRPHRVRLRTTLPGLRVIMLLVLLAITIVAAAVVNHNLRQARAERSARAEFRVVFAPLYASTARAAEDAAVMRDLLFESMEDAFRAEPDVRLLVKETETPPRTEEAAIELGDDVYADVVLWGRVIVLDDETVIEPMIAVHPRFESSVRARSPLHSSPFQPAVENAALEASRDSIGQISIRRSKADEIRDAAVVLSVSLYFLPKGKNQVARRLLAGARGADARILEGKIYEAELEWEEAAMSYEAALESEPGNPNAVLGLADLAFKTGRCRDAVDLYRRVRSQTAELPRRACRNFGLALGAIGEPEAMVEVLQDGVRTYPDLLFTPDALPLLRDQGQSAWVESFLKSERSRDLELVDYLLVDTYLSLGDYDRARAAVDAHFDRQVKEIGHGRWSGLGRLRRWFEVVAGVEGDLPASPLSAEQLNDWRAQSQARVEVLAGRPEQALEAFESSTRTTGNWELPGEVDPLLVALYLAGHFTEVEAACSKTSIGSDPSTAVVCGLAKVRRGEVDRARSMLDARNEGAKAAGPAGKTVGPLSHENAGQTPEPVRSDRPCFPVEFPAEICRVSFQEGAADLIRGDRERALTELERAVETEMRHLLEWRLATHELEQEGVRISSTAARDD